MNKHLSDAAELFCNTVVVKLKKCKKRALLNYSISEIGLVRVALWKLKEILNRNVKIFTRKKQKITHKKNKKYEIKKSQKTNWNLATICCSGSS